MSIMNAPRPAAVMLALASAFTPAARADSESPIDIRSDRSVHATLPPLRFDLSQSTTLTLVNSGTPNPVRNVRANVPAGAGSVTVAGVTFRLQQFHFHVTSEHKVNGTSFPMEMHMVTQDAAGATMVVGRFIEEGAENRAFDVLFRSLPGGPDAEATVADFDLNAAAAGEEPGVVPLPGLADGTAVRHRGQLGGAGGPTGPVGDPDRCVRQALRARR